MKKCLVLILCLWVSVGAWADGFQAGTEYYIALNIYDKYLGLNEAGDGPALSAFGTKGDASNYTFVAEATGTTGYVYLKHKGTGYYLAASTSNNYSVLLQQSKSNTDAFKWTAEVGVYGYLRNKRNTNARLGIDGGAKGSNYVNVYYDKHKGSHASFRIIPATSTNIETTEQNYVSSVYTNEWGVKEVDYIQLKNKTVSLSTATDIHIIDYDAPILSGTVNLNSADTWLVLDNVVPSKVISSYLKYVKIKGATAQIGVNCRVAIYLNGAVVIPLPDAPFTGYSSMGQAGSSFVLNVDSHTDLGSNSNVMRSFTLKRGYMATLATGTNGSGYSRVYVADHSDLKVDLPTPLDQRVTSVFVKEWQYVSKKGWCTSAANDELSTQMNKIRGTWFYSWSADKNSANDYEYIPIRQHLWWPSMDEIKSKKKATATLSLNEPEHKEQHSGCSCGDTVAAAVAADLCPSFQQTGARIGSPAPTRGTYLIDFAKEVDKKGYRCDFVAFHAYWGKNEANGAQAWYNTLKRLYESTKRPIWITEWNYGASWTAAITSDHYETVRRNVQDIVEMLDTCSFVERYSIYNWDSEWYRWAISKDDGWVTPMGQFYRDNQSTFAYNASKQVVPQWTAPSVKTPVLQVNGGGSMTFTINNENTDWTKTLVVQRSTDDGRTWAKVTEVTDRSLLESISVQLKNVVVSGASASDLYRVVVTTMNGATATSATAKNGGFLMNPMVIATSFSEIEGWTCTRDAMNGFTKAASGDTYFEVWNPAASAGEAFDYYQDVSGLPDGVYQLSANVFNSTNGEAGASVNGAVGLYAQTSDLLYFSPVTTDSEMDTNRKNLIDRIIVRDGMLRVGVRNLGAMTARWAGADNFVLSYLGTEAEVLTDESAEDVKARYMQVLIDRMKEDATGQFDASFFIKNADAYRATTYGWTASEVGFTKGEAYDGNAENNYFDKWSPSNFSSSMSQTLPPLPAGNYTLSAMMRSNTTQVMTLSATSSSGASSKVEFTGTAITSASGSEYVMGWQKIALSPIVVKDGETLTIALNTNGNSWWSADAFRLTYNPLVKMGDVNEDGKVDIADVVATVNYVLGTIPSVFNETAADVSGNGRIDISDVVDIVNLVLNPL